jgi:hypothetical protein
MIEGYRIYPGEHCGSASMRALLEHYCGLELPEPAVFGLGAGVDCMLIRGDVMDPPRAVFGRTGQMEVDLGRHLQLDYREETVDDDDEAWRIAREEVLAGRPTMLSGDILYLDYREYKVHFPAHRFVLLGFDDDIEKAFIADRIRDVPEACSYGALRESRNPPEGLSTHNLWGRFHDTAVGRSLPEAAAAAMADAAGRMLGSDNPNEQNDALFGGALKLGVPAIRELVDDLPSWGDHPKAGWIASFNARAIEKFGNGGGNFRRLYAGFLEWASALEPGLVPAGAADLALQAADGWTAMSEALSKVGEDGGPSEAWKTAAEHAASVAATEATLFERLAERHGAPAAGA